MAAGAVAFSRWKDLVYCALRFLRWRVAQAVRNWLIGALGYSRVYAKGYQTGFKTALTERLVKRPDGVQQWVQRRVPLSVYDPDPRPEKT